MDSVFTSSIAIEQINQTLDELASNDWLEDGQTLYEQVREQLINRYPLISIGWINHDTPFLKWTEPNLKQAAENLLELGAKVIIFKPIGWVTDNYETILEVKEAINSLRQQYPNVKYVQMNCVNDDPEFLKMAAEWAHPPIEALFSETSRNRS